MTYKAPTFNRFSRSFMQPLTQKVKKDIKENCMIDAKLLDTLETVWSYHCEFQHAAWVCGRFCVALWSLSSQPRPGAVPCALSLPRDYVHSWLAILTPPCMRHQLSPPAGQKERTRVQANNGTKLEVERATMFNVYRENLCYHFFVFKV